MRTRRGLDADKLHLSLNNHGEFDPLEIGIHAFRAVPVGKRGRGNKGDGLKAYAAEIGKAKQTVSELQQAGRVADKLSAQADLLLVDLLGKSKHLAAISKLPADLWAVLAQQLVEKGWSVTTRRNT